VISTGGNTFFGRAASLVGQDDETTGHLQKILAQISSSCLIAIGLFVILEIVIRSTLASSTRTAAVSTTSSCF
jgi:H+-transporting ATPase